MQETRDFAAPEESGAESSSRTVSFPDHYLVPYIQMCKRSKPITCGCSLIFIGLAIYFFFATSYKILFNYPITVSRKIACVFGGLCCLLAAFRCLELRFKVIQECRGERDDDTLFEIAHRDTEFSESFSGQFEMQEMPLSHGTPNEGPSQPETPADSVSRAHSIDDPCFPDTSKVHCNDGDRLPRRSISDGLTPDTPLLPQSRPLEFSRPSWMKRRMDSKRLQKDGIISDNNKCPSNYSTFDNNCEVSDTEPLLARSTVDNNCKVSDTEPLLARSTFDNNCEVSDTEPLLAKSMFDNGCKVSSTKPLLTKSTFRNGSNVPETEPLLAKSTFRKGCDASDTEPLLAKSTCRNGSHAPETKPLLAESMFGNDQEAPET